MCSSDYKVVYFKISTTYFNNLSYYLLQSMNQEDGFQDHSVQIKMSKRGLQKIYKFSRQQLDDIRSQFNRYADKNGQIDFQSFRNLVGLLGSGEAQPVCQRLFNVIVSEGQKKFELIDFIKFLSTMIYGNTKEKARLSFKFIDINKKKKIGYEQVSSILREISILWNYLTGEKTLPTAESTQNLCQKLGILENQEITFQQYLQIFEEDIFDWYAFFNDQVHQPSLKKDKSGPSLDQMESLLSLFSSELYDMILQLKESSQPILSFSNQEIDFNDVSPIKGPLHIQARFAPLRGDAEEHSVDLHAFEKVIQDLKQKQDLDKNSSFLSKVSNKLQMLANLGKKAYQHQNQIQVEILTQKTTNYLTFDKMRQRKATIMNKGRALKRGKSGTVYLGHQNWNLIVNMMLGIRKSVRVLYMPKQMESKLTQKHYDLQYQGKFAYELINKKDQKFEKQYCYTFVDYAPKVFYRIRADEGLTNESYLRSIGPQNLIGSLVTGKLATLNEQISSGKSGSFFYYTQDSRFVAKNISQSECHKVKNNLKNYRQHLLQNPNTYISKIFGLHKLRQTYGNKRYYFVVMQNVFRFPIQIDFRYDLKGSTNNRKGKTDGWSKNVALKDQDFVEQKRRIQILPSQKHRIFSQIKKDVHFFSLSNIIDYSLLVGIHEVRGRSQQYQQIEKFQQFKGIMSKEKKEIYFLGFIDYFSDYSTIKLFSSLPPLDYQKRFIQFLYSQVFGK